MIAKNEDINSAINLERQLYIDLANALPSGIYRIRVFHNVSFSESNWRSKLNAPYLVEFVNKRFCDLLSIDLNDYLVNPTIFNDLIYEEDKADFVQKNIEANIYVTPFIWEGRFLINDEIHWMQFESTPRILENKDIMWTGTLNDVTERRNAELEIKKNNEELFRLNTEKAKFLSILAHDLSSPFNSIIGYSRQIKDIANENNNKQIEKNASNILESSYKALNLFTDLMDWAQSNSGRMSMNPEEIEIGEIISIVINLFEESANKKSISIENNIDSIMLAYADKYMINTVFRNILSNAIKFTNPGGQIIIESNREHNFQTISIKDTGIGIPSDKIEKIFQLDKTFSTLGTHNERGTGLGLIICKEFIEKNQGRLEIESEIGFGSTCKISIPLLKIPTSTYKSER